MTLLALVLASATRCANPDAVSLDVQHYGVKNAIRQIAEQSKVSIAVSPRVRGPVTVDVTCVPPRMALQRVLAQVNGVYCEEGDTIVVRRKNERGCRAVWSADAL
jgi:type II secretory pathway component HofQ